MTFDELNEAISLGLSQRKIAKKFGCSQSTMRYWLSKYQLKTFATCNFQNPRLNGTIICRMCERKGWKHKGDMCGSCRTRVRRYRTKLAAIQYKGGKCSSCGWNGLPAAFDFHHIGDKDFSIGSATNKSWKIIKAELDKCVLLCANCHALEHCKHADVRLIEEASRYHGKNIDFSLTQSRSIL